MWTKLQKGFFIISIFLCLKSFLFFHYAFFFHRIVDSTVISCSVIHMDLTCQFNCQFLAPEVSEKFSVDQSTTIQTNSQSGKKQNLDPTQMLYTAKDILLLYRSQQQVKEMQYWLFFTTFVYARLSYQQCDWKCKADLTNEFK